MALTPLEITELIAQAEKAFAEKSYNQALNIFYTIIRNNPDYAPAHRHLGSLLMLTPSQDKALESLKKAISLAPTDADNWIVLGDFYKRSKQLAERLGALENAIKYKQDNTSIYFDALQIRRQLEHYKIALDIATLLRDREPENLAFLWEYAQLLELVGRDREAIDSYRELISSDEERLPIEAIKEWSDLMSKHGRQREVESFLHSKLDIDPDNAQMQWLYGLECISGGRYDEAHTVLQLAHTLAPDNADILNSIGVLYTNMGDSKKGRSYYDKCLEIHPYATSILHTIGSTHTYSYGDETFTQLNFAAANMADLSQKEQTDLHYALGKAYSDVGELSTAFGHYKRGGILHSHSRVIESDMISQIISSIKKTKSYDRVWQQQEQGSQSHKPIFIVGIPRSGTTLMEQVLSQIDGIYGAGELNYSVDALQAIEVAGERFCWNRERDIPDEQDYLSRGEHYLSDIEALAPKESRYIIDKMPDNFRYAGLLHLILPNATIIHARRHPVETCLSAYRLRFKGGHYWSDDLQTMGRYYRLYTELMSLWESILPEGTILDIRYEDMVDDLESTSKRITDHIGVEWDPSCLEFHKSSKTILTASHSQVKKPIYKTSTNRWRKYEPYLQPLLDELGDLVEEYENELEIRSL